MNYWLFKTEPTTYSFSKLLKDRKTNWNGVRNYQARNFLREVKVGDLAVIYHSGDDKAAVGVARVTKAGYADPDPEGGDWVQVDIAPVEAFEKPIALAEMKTDAVLKTMPLIRQSRLSCMPITQAHFSRLKKLGGESA